jgi:hypothetical protein
MGDLGASPKGCTQLATPHAKKDDSPPRRTELNDDTQPRRPRSEHPTRHYETRLLSLSLLAGTPRSVFPAPHPRDRKFSDGRKVYGMLVDLTLCVGCRSL